MIDYTEELFNAIKTISKKEIEALKFDTTIEATITDVSRAKYGVYTVTNGSVYFTVYSTNTEYKNKDTVLIMIPRGDYNQQKIIVGKKASTDIDKPINYTTPFSQIVDITNNLVSNISETSMIANGDDYKWENNDTSLFANIDDILTKTNLVWSARSYELGQEDTFKEEKGLTRIGLKADFRTSLKQFNTISGNYGLVLCVGFRNPDEQLPTGNSLHSTIIQPFIFDSKDFFGNIYNFNTYYNQEAVFDISQYSDLILSDLFLFAYQKNNFKDINNALIPHNSGNPNIFINNYYICLGQEFDTFDKDSLTLTSLSSKIYSDEDKNKTISLRWIHKDENTNKIKSLTQKDFNDIYSQEYEIRWYVNSFNNSPDSFTEAHWDRYIGTTNQDITTNKLSIEYNFEDALEKKESQKKFQAAVIKKDLDGNGSYLVARSNILEFNNQNDVNKGLTIRDINALGIQFKDSEQGYYLTYNSFYELENNEDTVIRELTAVFADETENVYSKSPIDSYERITWIIPFENSMIIPLDYMRKKITGAYRATENGYNYNIEVDDGNRYYIITHEKNNSDTNDNVYNDQFYTTIPYQINKTLDFNNQNNTIYLELEKTTGAIYTAQATMYFNKAGTSGSDYTMIIKWDQQNVVFDISKVDEQLTGQMILLNPKGQICDLNNSEAKYTYNWYKYDGDVDSPSLEVIPIEDDDLHENLNNFKFKIQKRDNSSISINELYILEVKLTNFQNYELITRVPIPLTQSAIDGQELFNVDQITGPTQIRYSTDGSLFFDKTPYNISFQMKKNEQWGTSVEDASDVGYWRIIPEDTSEAYLINDVLATFDNIIHFFINVDNDFVQERKHLLYRLISATIEGQIDDDSLFKLKKIENIYINKNNLDNFINEICSSTTYNYNAEEVLFNNDYNTFLSYIDKYRKCFNNNNQISLLLELLQRIAYYSKEYDNNNKINTLTGLLKSEAWDNYLKSVQLLPSTFYASNSKLYGVQYVYNKEMIINEQHMIGIVLWTQPIYIYQDTYPSPTLNQWDGKLIIDNDKNTILVKGLSAGTKDENNQFSGVMFGDWKEDSTHTFLTGIYGFKQGAMTYALKEDGSAFFRNEKGEISLNGKNAIELKVEDNNNLVQIKPGGIIIQTREDINNPYIDLLKIDKEDNKNIYLLQSKNFSVDDQTGMKLDLQNGEIKGYNFSLFSQTSQNNTNYSLELSSGQNNLPFLRIGREQISNANINTVDTTTTNNNLNEDSTLLINMINSFQENVDQYYADFISLLTLFIEFYQLDSSIFNFDYYKTILKFPEINSDDDNALTTKEKLLSYIKEQENENNAIVNNNQFIENWYQNWSFDEIPNIFLNLLTDQQKNEIKELLKLLRPEEDNYNFIININKNLFYPKVPKNKLNLKTYADTLYNKCMKKYNDDLAQVKEADGTYLTYLEGDEEAEKINNINNSALKIIKQFNLLATDYTYKKIQVNDYQMSFIVLEKGNVYEIPRMFSGGTGGMHNNFYAWFDNYINNTSVCSDARLEKDSAYSDFLGGDIYKRTLIIDDRDTRANHLGIKLVTINNAVFSYTEPAYMLTLDKIKYNNSAIDLYTGLDKQMTYIETNKEPFDEDKRFNVYFIYAMKKTPSDNLIGLQKIKAIIQEKLYLYEELLTKCQNILSELKSAEKDSYTKLEGVISSIFNNNKNNNYLNKKNTYTNDIYVAVPLDFSFREDLKITLKDLQHYYKYNQTTGEMISCGINDFQKNNADSYYSLLNNYQYYILFSSFKSLKSYFYIYENYEVSGRVEQENDTQRLFYSLNTFQIDELGIQALNKNEELYNTQQTTVQNGNIAVSNEDIFIFDQKKWNNDLINITKNGGYITSLSYRPTMTTGETKIRNPNADQENRDSSVYTQGMKGFAIDLTNNRIFLGNNASIQGVQTQYYPGQTDVQHRHFIISNGVTSQIDKDGRDRITSDNKWFILSSGGWNAGRGGISFRYLFGVDWDGIISCRGITGFTDGTLEIKNNLKINGHFISKYQYDVFSVYDTKGNVHTGAMEILNQYNPAKKCLLIAEPL